MKTAPLEGVNYFISGGDALPDKIRAAFALLYRRTICNGYGLTETSPIVSANMADEMGPTNSVGQICLVLIISCAMNKESQYPPIKLVYYGCAAITL